MPTFYANDIDVDVDEFLDECSTSEIEEVIDWLRDSGYLTPLDEAIDGPQSFQDEDFNNALLKLVGNRYKLSVEDEQTIMAIANRLP
jgi:hypothetical protein